MNDERRREIALMIVEAEILEKGIPGAQKFRQDAGNLALKLNIKLEELGRFYQTFVPKLYGRIFNYDSVAIDARNAGD